MSSAIINQLPLLQANSDKQIKQSVIDGFKGHLSYYSGSPLLLVQPKMIASTNWIHVPRNGANSLSDPKNRVAIRKVMTLTAGQENNFTYSLNTALLGGENYPILTAVLGTVAGIASFGAGLLFTVATTGLSLAQTSQRVLGRAGDEIWQVEEIGKVQDGGKPTAMHVNSYLIVDPFRGQSQQKGWLIHEERNEMTLD